MTPMIRIRHLRKTFTLHQQDGQTIPVLQDFSLDVAQGECVVLRGHSGVGKSTVLRSIYGNYLVQSGTVMVRRDEEWVDLSQADARTVLRLRRETIGYVSQFLRVIPRVPTLDIVAQPMLARGTPPGQAREHARTLLRALDIPERLWPLPPATFSGGEQQRVNIARGFVQPYAILLLDEPTAALDAENRERVVTLIRQARAAGAAIVGIFHDDDVGERVATRQVHMHGARAA